MKICGIYKITNPNSRIYIGQSINIKNRFWSYMSKGAAKNQHKLYNSLKNGKTFKYTEKF